MIVLHMETSEFEQTVIVENAEAEDLYNLFMDAELHSELIGQDVDIQEELGYEYSLFDGQVTGKVLEIEPYEKIVLSWKGGEKEWPTDHYSEVEIIFENSDGGGVIKLSHKNIPEELAESYAEGWYDYYWNPIKEDYS